MPEGHTIRRIANQWAEEIGVTVRAEDPNGRFPAVQLIDGATITQTDANGKHLFIGFDNELWLHVHLGRFGRFWWHTGDLEEPRASVRVRLISDDWWVDLRGPITCEVIDGEGKQRVQDSLGPDPLRPQDRTFWASGYIRGSRRYIGALLMDQGVIAGIGNIYRAEVLWRNRISPYRRGVDITEAEFDALYADTVVLLTDGVGQGRTGTGTAHVPMPDGSSPIPEGFGSSLNRTFAYQRAGLPCPRDGHPIVRDEMDGRGLFWCPECQH